MLAFLLGTILYKSTTFVILEHDGVGYQILLAPHQIEQAELGKPAQFYTFEYVREERRELYGFATPEDLEFFFMLIDVQGVGPRSAQKIIGHASIGDIKAAIIADNFAFLSAIPRLGTKTAGKLILELKPKLTNTKKVTRSVILSERSESKDPDIEEALKRLGYSADEISMALPQLPNNKKISSEEKIKSALKLLRK